MARVVYDCNSLARNNDNYTVTGPVFCTPDLLWPDKQYCCNPQCCSVVQRRQHRQIWETWYFWLGLALLILFLLTSVSSYLVSSCKNNLQTSPLGFFRSPPGNEVNNPENVNQISINVIATPEPLSSHRKMVLVAPRASLTHMTPVVA